ncbi:hypothetical protein CR513_54260, partial [Mucuna pruriens]
MPGKTKITPSAPTPKFRSHSCTAFSGLILGSEESLLSTYSKPRVKTKRYLLDKGKQRGTRTHQNEVVSEAVVLGEMEKAGLSAVEEGGGGGFDSGVGAHGGRDEAGIRVFESALRSGQSGSGRMGKVIVEGGESAASGGCERNGNGGGYGHRCNFQWRRRLHSATVTVSL